LDHFGPFWTIANHCESTAQLISGADGQALLSEYDAAAAEMSRPHFDLGNFSMASGACVSFSGISAESMIALLFQLLNFDCFCWLRA
jgi:hypothetical protein